MSWFFVCASRVARALAAALSLVAAALPAHAAGVLTVDVINGYNLVVDSNVTAPSTYAPASAYIGARVCNTGDAPLADVFLHTGNYNGGVGSTPGVFPVHDSTGDAAHPQITNTGNYSLTLEAGDTGTSDGQRYIGTLAPGQCRVDYWLFSYPQCVNVGGSTDTPPCAKSITGGVHPDDDVSLDYDVWATTSTAIAAPAVNVRRDFTLRNEISAAANKIWPNTTSKVPDAYLAAIQALIGWGTLGPDGQPLSNTNPVYPGQHVITTQGIWYDLGNVVHGFDNDGDLVPDQNAWLQPVGDPSQFDAGCFRMINVYGILIVKLKTGGETLIPFQNQLYFEHIPDNTGVVGLVYYQYIATESGCSSNMTPYQESASGFDNEKFSSDFGLSNGLSSGEFGPNVSFSKTDGVSSTTIGSTLTYTVSATNNTGVPLGAPQFGVPVAFRETIPTGTTYVTGSADDSPNTNLTEPTGSGSYTQGTTDIDGNLDSCTINYNITSSQWVVLYSTNNGASWTTTEPASGVTSIQWLLQSTLALDGHHDGTQCVAPNGVYDNGTLQTSLPPGKTVSTRFQVTVAPTVGPVVCNTAGFSLSSADPVLEAQDCTLIAGNNTLSGNVFKDEGTGGGIYGNGIKDGTEAGIGAGILVTLYADANGNGQIDSTDPVHSTTTTSAGGAYSFTSLADGAYLVSAKKYDGSSSNGVNDAVSDSAFGAVGYGNTTTDPQLPLTTNQGVLQMTENATVVVLAVNLDRGKTTAVAQSVTNVDFGFAPPLRVTKVIAGNPDTNADGRADTIIDEGNLFTYLITLENRLPSVGTQGATGCQYVAWANTGANGSPASKAFTNPNSAWDGPNRQSASTLVEGGGLRYIDGSGFTMRTQAGNITKVEALYFGYFSAALTDDTLGLKITQGAVNNTTTMTTALIDSYVGEPLTLDPNNAISWDVTSLRPGGGTWSWADNFSSLRLEINPSKASSADQKTFYLDAIGIRITTDQPCEAVHSTTLSPVPLQDSYDAASVAYVSASPAPTSVNTATGVLQWSDVGPIPAGSSKTVTVTVRALNISGSRIGSCGASSPPAANSVCNWAETAFGANRVYYSDGRPAVDASSKIAASLIGKGELRGTIWKDTDADGWPREGGEPLLPNVTVTLFACVQSSGALETGTPSKTCTAATGGNAWRAIATTPTSSSGAWEFVGLDTGYYIVEVGDTDGAPGTGNTSPFGGTQTAEPNDSQAASGGFATGTNGVCAGGCNNTWGNPAANLNTLNLINSPTAEEIIGGIDFGYNIPNAVLYGNVWWDVDGDTITDAGDTGLSGFTVQRWSDPNGDGNPADGALQATTTTDSSGNYSFGGLSPASYVIVVVPPALLNTAWVETVETTGGTSSLNNQIPVTIATVGQLSGSHNFGYKQASTSQIGDTLFYDFDADGIQDATETGIPNVTVWLYQDVDRDGTIDTGIDPLYATTATNSSGTYLFSTVPAGSYVVKVDTADADFPTDVTPTGDPDISAASIGDLIWLDSNGNGTRDTGEDGIAGVILNLYSDNDGSGSLNASDSLVSSASTDTNGNYLFTGLAAGRYFVDVNESSLPSTVLALTTTDPASTLITLASSGIATQVLTADAGYSPAANFSIGNRLWHDLDNDGVQDPGEPGIPFVDIVVTNGTGTGCSTPCRVSTDASGFWIVTGLTNGTFSVNVDETDADFPRNFTVATGTTDPRTVTVASADLTNVDFGYRYTGTGSTPTGTITGRIFLDGDNDLAYDLGEGRSATTVNLFDSNGEVAATTVSAADGTYAFTGIFVGTYTVQAVDRLGTRYSTIFLSAAQTVSGVNVVYRSSMETTADSQSAVSVDGVYANLLQDFGYQRFTASIGDTIYWDTNENATQDIGEPGLANVTVRLYDAVWTDSNGNGMFESGEGSRTLLSTTSTIADNPATSANEGGTYLFTNLAALATGHYYLVEVVTTTLPGVAQTLIADPDTDGYPCTLLPSPDVANDDFPPPTVCDSQQLVRGFFPGNNYLGADFGYRITGGGYATIGDQLWIDTDGDGARDSGEPGIGAISVWLDTDSDGVLDWADANANGTWDSGEGERWVQTDVDGFYVFTGMADGTYNVKVLTSDPQWPSGLPVTPTFEVRSGNTTGRNNAAQVIITSGAVSTIDDGDPATTDTCSNCNLSIDFGYRYAGTNALSGTVCTDDSSKNGYCGATATTYSGVTSGESALPGIQVSAYRWTDDGDNTAWSGATLDSGDSFVLVGTTSTNAAGDYSFSNLPDNVVISFSVADSQELRLTTTLASSSVEDANVIKRQLYEGTSLYNGNTVTVLGREALSLGGDVDDNVQDLDFAFDPTLSGSIARDFGDLPAGYANTLLANSGARHRVTGTSIYLGAGVTSENDGTTSATAAADGNDDGVTMVSDEFNPGGGAYINVVASAAGWLAAWMDFNGDGDFNDANEWILDQAVTSGLQELSFYVPPAVATNGVTDFFTRFRIYPSRPSMVASTGPALSSTFDEMEGEVEDYVFPMSIGPTMVEMFSMDGVQGKRGVTLTWQTTREVDNLGFHVYRQLPGGTPEKVNAHIITGSAFVTGRRSEGPRSYRFVDRKPVEGFVQYWIEDVDLNGTKTMHGPITPRTATSESDEPPVTTDPDPTLGSVGGIFTTQPGMGVAIPAPPAPGTAQRDEQWQLASVPAVKVIVTRPGWYRVKKSDLVAAGFDPGDNGRVLSVFTDGTEVPVLVNAKNEGRFEADDSIEFFGRGIDTPSTGGRVYYITARRGSGLRVKSTGGRGNSGSPAPASFPYTFERVEKTVFFTSMVTNGDRENFYGPVLTSWPVDQALTVSNRDSGNAQLEIAVQGVTPNLEHVIQVKVNGSTIGVVRIPGRNRRVTTLNVSSSLLVEGNNTVTLTAQNGWDDVSVLESLRLVYPHRFRADNDALAFTVSAGTKVAVGGFSTDKVRVVDVTDPMVPQLIDADVTAENGGTRSVSFATTGSGTRTIFAFAETRVLAPAQIAWNEPSTWNAASNAANLVIITNRAFTASASSLKAARDAQGIATAVVDVQNLYDEFSYGHHSPEAIRSFLAQTATWKVKPRYVILLGDASFDPRNYIGFGSYDFVPTKLVPTRRVKTASDDWFADFNNSGVPSLAIGRIPARTAAQAKAVVDKLIARGASAPSGGWAQYVEIVADAPNGYPFDRAAGQVAAQIPSAFTVDRISIATTPSPATAIQNAFNRGSILTNYIGHGSTELWSNGHFSSRTAASLANGNRLPFVVSMNCLNGYFHDLFSESIAEALMNNANGGAIGVWASSALTGVAAQVEMNLVFNRHVFGATPMTVGDAALLAKQATPNSDVRRTWILFGDPTIKLK